MKVRERSYLMGLAIGNAIFYNAWVLGFWLNPELMATHLLSSLGALNQPYHAVFIAFEVVAGLFALFLGGNFVFKNNEKILKVLGMCCMSFGVFTILAALFAEHNQGVTSLKISWELVHMIFSGLSIASVILMMVFSLKILRTKGSLFLILVFGFTMLLFIFRGEISQFISASAQKINSISGGSWIIYVTYCILKIN